MSDLAPVLQEFFTRRLVSQRDASPATITAYRDTFRLLIVFAAGRPARRRARSAWPTLTPRSSPRSCSTCRTIAATASGPATPGWRQSTPCSPTPPSAIPSTER